MMNLDEMRLLFFGGVSTPLKVPSLDKAPGINLWGDPRADFGHDAVARAIEDAVEHGRTYPSPTLALYQPDTPLSAVEENLRPTLALLPVGHTYESVEGTWVRAPVRGREATFFELTLNDENEEMAEAYGLAVAMDGGVSFFFAGYQYLLEEGATQTEQAEAQARILRTAGLSEWPLGDRDFEYPLDG